MSQKYHFIYSFKSNNFPGKYQSRKYAFLSHTIIAFHLRFFFIQLNSKQLRLYYWPIFFFFLIQLSWEYHFWIFIVWPEIQKPNQDFHRNVDHSFSMKPFYRCNNRMEKLKIKRNIKISWFFIWFFSNSFIQMRWMMNKVVRDVDHSCLFGVLWWSIMIQIWCDKVKMKYTASTIKDARNLLYNNSAKPA